MRRLRAHPWLVATLAWVAFIWLHSLVQGPESSVESGLVVSLVRPVLQMLGMTSEDAMTLLVRKLAHFGEYLVLGLLGHRCALEEGATRATKGRARPPWPLALALVPVVDESIQLLVPGRQGSPVDVLIDLSGLLLGLGIGYLASRAGRPTGA